MLIITEPKILYNISYNPVNTVVLNLNANVTTFETLRLMPPYNWGVYIDSPNFDQEYISLILSYNNYFMEFMKILIPLQRGMDVILLVYKDETVFDSIVECIVKLIQQRYGYQYNIIDSVTEYDTLNTETSTFTTPGIIQLDQDLNRYYSILAQRNPYMFINEIINEV